MTGTQVRAARQRLGIAPEELAARVDMTVRELHDFESLPDLPKRAERELDAALWTLERDRALEASGLPECPTVQAWGEKTPGAGEVMRHSAGCAACRARRDYVAKHVRPNPMDRGGNKLDPTSPSEEGMITALVHAGAPAAVLIFAGILMGALGFWASVVLAFSLVAAGALAGVVHRATRDMRRSGGHVAAWLLTTEAGALAVFAVAFLADAVGLSGRRGIIGGVGVGPEVFGAALAGAAALLGAALGLGARKEAAAALLPTRPARLSTGVVATYAGVLAATAGIGATTWSLLDLPAEADVANTYRLEQVDAYAPAPVIGPQGTVESYPEEESPAETDELYAGFDEIDRLMLESRWPEAEAKLRETLHRTPNDAANLRRLGNVLSIQGKHADAVVELRRADELSPGSLSVFSAALGYGTGPEALPRLREAVRSNPRDVLLWGMLAEAEYVMGEVDDAKAAVRKAREIDGRWVDRHPILRGIETGIHSDS